MTAAEIIELLREHPVCCERLGIVVQFYARDDRELWWGNTMVGTGDTLNEIYRHAIIGAGVEWCIEHGVALPVRWKDGWASPRSDSTESATYPTFLHALLAAIEGATP